VAASLAEGTTTIRDARELRVKETDRIRAMATNLAAAGITVEETEDGMVIQGAESFGSCTVESFGDHRIAMSLIVAGLRSRGEGIRVQDTECINTSFPVFFDLLSRVGGA
jgi:3-phosphoshikimate 1-carboxyvinyltransferase